MSAGLKFLAQVYGHDHILSLMLPRLISWIPRSSWRVLIRLMCGESSKWLLKLRFSCMQLQFLLLFRIHCVQLAESLVLTPSIMLWEKLHHKAVEVSIVLQLKRLFLFLMFFRSLPLFLFWPSLVPYWRYMSFQNTQWLRFQEHNSFLLKRNEQV